MKTNKSEKEVGLDKIKSLIAKYSNKSSTIHNANEASTRLLLIDETLKILGWHPNDFNPESHTTSNGFVDYLLTHDGVPKLVVEAKKIGVTFSSPSNRKMHNNDYAISYFKQAFKQNLTDTINQASQYCKDNRVTHAVITNGAEWFAMQLVPKPGKSIDGMKGIYFGNLFTDNFYYDLFYDLLSKNSVSSGELEQYLNEINYAPSPINLTLSNHYGKLKWGSYHSTKYTDEFYLSFFDEITNSNQKKMLEHCFVADSKLEQYKGDLKRLLKDTTPNYLPFDTEDLDPGESARAIINDHQTGKVILITGSVGCGKSTLVQKVINETKINHKHSTTPIIVDLINDVTQREVDAKNIIINRVNEALLEKFPETLEYENLKQTYNSEINALKSGPYQLQFKSDFSKYIDKEAELLEKLKSKTDNFVIRTLKNQKHKGKPAILIIDNVDRASEHFQEETYVLAHKIAKESGSTVIITMREFTYFTNKDSGWLDVRSGDRVIHLKAPDFNKIISKRIKYIEKHFDEDFRIKEWRKSYDLNEFKKSCLEHAEVLKKTIQRKIVGQRILETLSCISWHNIRMFHKILKSTHKKIGNDKLWEFEEVIASLMISEDSYALAPIPNIFIPTKNINKSYFLKLRLLHFLLNNDSPYGTPLKKLISFAKMYGYHSNWITIAIEESIKHRLIECVEIPTDGGNTLNFTISQGKTFKISPLGAILVKDIVSNKVYLSLIANELPFHDKEHFNSTKKEYEEFFSYMGDTYSEVIRDGLSLIENSGLSSSISSYLLNQFKQERICESLLNSDSEIKASEQKIDDFINYLKSNFKQKTYQNSNLLQSSFEFGGIDDISSTPQNDESDLEELIADLIPTTLDIVREEKSEYAPLIFTALLIRKFLGHEASQGIDLTKTINMYIVDEQNKKASPNVSRALRTTGLNQQPWLLIRDDLHTKFKTFSLAEKWEEHWLEYFGEKPNI
ncbi:P-loop NTPase fold protein [Shewanella waksmanii]|uniref:P-loop NTPase fold protein n=1 Tax=Shewanella waksmanii TaxID=213783 RepID=UPI0037370ADD